MQEPEGFKGINMSSSNVLQMLDKYSQGTSNRRANLRLLNLANEETLRLATLAHDIVSWHIKIKQLIFTAHDIGNKGSPACQGERFISEPGYGQSLEYYFKYNLDDLAIDIKLQSPIGIEPSVVDRLKHCSNTQTRITKEATANVQTPAILCLNGCCSAYAGDNKPNKDSTKLDRFFDVFKTAHDFLYRNLMPTLRKTVLRIHEILPLATCTTKH